ncbi:hypothetical protein [Oligoflexus tunisiensis]|uniref:hypothetical protein n=1 Tax=Oligoflexus tunisiensis TaxID=708132 RepID=UPI00114CBD2E|nr:hypothetical protein [Oligoflexus tunisiensis]
MVYKKSKFYVIFISAILSACAHYSERLESSLQGWVGKHPDQLVELWGAPRSVYVMEKGNKVLTFEASELYSRTLGYWRRPEIYTQSENCKISFFTDASQKSIERYSYSGSTAACYDMLRSAPGQK